MRSEVSLPRQLKSISTIIRFRRAKWCKENENNENNYYSPKRLRAKNSQNY